MKKMIFSLAAVGLLASCSQNEIQEMTEKSNEIKFSTLNDKVTRAANDTNDPYQVFAKLSNGEVTGDYWFMNETLIPGTANSGTNSDGFNNYTSRDQIQSGNKFYWPANNGWILNFYGFAPAHVYSMLVEDKEYKSLNINYTVPTATEKGDAQEDFTIAIPQSFTDKTKPSGNNVHFQFKHMLSKVTISVDLTKALKDAGYSVSYGAENIHTPSLTVLMVNGTINAMDDTPTWENLTDVAGEGYDSYNDLREPLNEWTTYTGNSNYLILPQSSPHTSISLPVVIKKNGVIVFEGDVTYTIKPDDMASNEFLPGKNYGMNITINGESTTGPDGKPIFGHEIIFSSEVANWDEVTIEKPQPGKPDNN